MSVLAFFVLGATSEAAEVQFEGFYRARMRGFHTLSLNNQLPESEGSSLFVQHRLWLRPRFVLNDNVALFTEFRGLDNVNWGDEPGTIFDPVSEDDVPPALVDDLHAPTSATDENAPLADFTLWRAWGEVHTNIGRFRFGRQPLHWGMGIWQNDGLGLWAEYGDTADRFSWEYLVQNSVYVSAAIDINAENFINTGDDTASYNLAAAYRSEKVVAGLNAQYRRIPDPNFNLFTIDLAFDGELGKLELHSETIGQFGSGDLDDVRNEVSVTSVGAVLKAGLNLNPWAISIEGGLASGDGTTDNRVRTFTFDRDYNVALVMFERPLPTLAASAATDLNGNQSFETTLTGGAVSNALYLKPRLSRELVEDKFDLELAAILGRVAKLPDTAIDTRKSYGMEFDLTGTYTPFDHFELGTTFGVFLPGSFYRDYVDPDNDAFKEFDDPVWAGQINARIDF